MDLTPIACNTQKVTLNLAKTCYRHRMWQQGEMDRLFMMRLQVGDGSGNAIMDLTQSCGGVHCGVRSMMPMLPKRFFERECGVGDRWMRCAYGDLRRL